MNASQNQARSLEKTPNTGTFQSKPSTNFKLKFKIGSSTYEKNKVNEGKKAYPPSSSGKTSGTGSKQKSE
jgi:hypothetical protein